MYKDMHSIRIYKKASYKKDKKVPNYIELPFEPSNDIARSIANSLGHLYFTKLYKDGNSGYKIDIKEYYGVTIDTRGFYLKVRILKSKIDKVDLMYRPFFDDHINLKDFYMLAKLNGHINVSNEIKFTPYEHLEVKIKEEKNAIILQTRRPYKGYYYN